MLLGVTCEHPNDLLMCVEWWGLGEGSHFPRESYLCWEREREREKERERERERGREKGKSEGERDRDWVSERK